MKTFSLSLIVFGLLTHAHAANYFVTPNGSGSANGKDWSNATSMSGVTGKSLAAGDVIYLAGGDYGSQGMNWGRGGKDGNPIIFKRVLASDADAVSAPGWDPSFDSQVVTKGTFSANPGPGNITFDGRVLNGILIKTSDSNTTWILLNGGNNYTIRYVTFKGPGWGPYAGYGINWINGTGHLCDHVIFDGVNQQLSWSVSSGIVQYCQFLNAGPGTSDFHSDSIYCGGMSNSTFRYNYFYNSHSQSFFWDGGGNGTVYIYGNVANQGPKGNGTWFQCKQGYNWGTFHFFNNTMIGWSTAGIQFRGTLGGTCRVENNAFWNTNWTSDSGTSGGKGQYNVYSSGFMPPAEPHSSSISASPFVDVSDSSISPQNFLLVSGSAPINSGTPISIAGDPDVAKDMNGNARGNGGAWDIGAFEFNSSGAGPTPTPPQPTPTPAPTATPAPTPTPGSKFKVNDTVTPTAVVNIRATPSGTILGTHKPGDTGTVMAGPEMVPLKQDVNWYQITWTTSPLSGWSGDDDLAKAAGPSPTPSPLPSPTATPTPNPSPSPDSTFSNWTKELNAAQSDWIEKHPPQPD